MAPLETSVREKKSDCSTSADLHSPQDSLPSFDEVLFSKKEKTIFIFKLYVITIILYKI